MDASEDSDEDLLAQQIRPPRTVHRSNGPLKWDDLSASQRREYFVLKRARWSASAKDLWWQSEPVEGSAIEPLIMQLGAARPYSTQLRFHPGLYCAESDCRSAALVAASRPARSESTIELDRVLVAWSHAVIGVTKAIGIPAGIPAAGAVWLDEFEDELLIAPRLVTAIAAGAAMQLPAAAVNPRWLHLLEFPARVRRVQIAAHPHSRRNYHAALEDLRRRGITATLRYPPNAKPTWERAALDAVADSGASLEVGLIG